MKEKELLEKLRIGDATAYKYLFDEYYNWLCNYVYNLCNDRSLSEDIVQDAIVNFWNKRERLLVTVSLKNYLFRTCHNQFLQYIRTKKIEFDFLDTIRWESIAEIYTEDEKIKEDRLDKLKLLIDELPPRCKEIFVKNKLEKRKYKEIAFDMNISIKTVENQMSKALHFLKENASYFML